MSPTRVRTADGQLLEHGWMLQVIELAKIGGWFVYHAPDNRPGRRTGRPQRVLADTTGFPDLILVRRGELLAIELKTDKGRLAPEQQDWLDRFARVGEAVRRMINAAMPPAPDEDEPVIEAHVWRPRDIDIATERLIGNDPGTGRIHEPKEGR